MTLPASPAFAKNASVSDTIPIVTIRKEAERPADIPGVVQLIDRQTIEKAKIRTPSDLTLLVPGFSFNDPFGRFNPAPSFRGLIQPGLGDDPSVGFFNDGIYLSGRSSVNSLAFDLDRIEIAKGPQNALYGRNAFGGAINFVSAKPSDETTYWVDGRSATYDRREVQAGFNLPLSPFVKTRLALYSRDVGSYFDNAVPGGPDIGSESTKAARLSVALTPSLNRDILLSLTHITDDDGQPKGFLVAANCGPRTSDGQFRLYCGELPARGPTAANLVDPQQGYHRDHTRGAATWTEHLGYGTSLSTLIGGAVEDSLHIRDDDYQSPNAARAGIDTQRFDAQFDTHLNHRTRDGTWTGLAGLSGYRFLNHVDRLDQLYILGQTSPGGPRVKNTTDTLGMYGSVTRQLPHRFAITGDARWQWEGKDLTSTTPALTTGQPISLEDSWTAFTPKLTGSWTGLNGLLLYASTAEGYKTGGFNDRANLNDNERVYDPEENITYEIGAKNIPLAQTLTADLGGFWIGWTDQQVTAYSNAGVTQNFFINNAGQTTSKGIEAALRWQAKRNLSFGLGYTYADARYDSYRDPDLANVAGFAPSGDVSGNRLPRYSPHQLSLVGSYRKPLGIANWNFVLDGQVKYDSPQYTDNSSTSRTGARSLMNLQANIENERITFGLWAENVLSEKDPAVGIPWTDATQGFRREFLVVPQEGAILGLRLKVKM